VLIFSTVAFSKYIGDVCFCTVAFSKYIGDVCFSTIALSKYIGDVCFSTVAFSKFESRICVLQHYSPHTTREPNEQASVYPWENPAFSNHVLRAHIRVKL
jgi:hypothetical protein